MRPRNQSSHMAVILLLPFSKARNGPDIQPIRCAKNAIALPSGGAAGHRGPESVARNSGMNELYLKNMSIFFDRAIVFKTRRIFFTGSGSR